MALLGFSRAPRSGSSTYKTAPTGYFLVPYLHVASSEENVSSSPPTLRMAVAFDARWPDSSMGRHVSFFVPIASGPHRMAAGCEYVIGLGSEGQIPRQVLDLISIGAPPWQPVPAGWISAAGLTYFATFNAHA